MANEEELARSRAWATRWAEAHPGKGSSQSSQRVQRRAATIYRKFPERLWGYVQKTDTCWLWRGTAAGVAGDEYGAVNFRTVQLKAHRVIYEIMRGPIPDGLHLDHLCRVHMCVNPDHLEPVTCRENILRGMGPASANAIKTHCKRGHEFTPENTYVFRRLRSCRACQRQRWREHQVRAVGAR